MGGRPCPDTVRLGSNTVVEDVVHLQYKKKVFELINPNQGLEAHLFPLAELDRAFTRHMTI